MDKKRNSPTHRTAHGDHVRAEILNGARQLFKKKGVANTTLEDIAHCSGTDSGILCDYFKYPSEVFEAIMIQDMQEVFTETIKAVENQKTAEDKLKAFILDHMSILQQKAILLNNIICYGNIANDPKLLRRIKNEYEAKELEMLEYIIRCGVINNEFKEIKMDDISDLSYVTLKGLRAIEISLLEHSKASEMNDRLQLVLNVLSIGWRSK